MSKKFESSILEVIELSPTVKQLKIWVPQDFNFKAGQYISLILPEGKLTPIIDDYHEGHNLEFLGPLGEFTITNKEQDLIFISSGSGIGPFRSMIHELLENNFKHKITLITGYRSEEDLLYHNEFTQLAEENPNFTYSSILSQPSPLYENKIGYVQDLIKDFQVPKEANYYICGLNNMITSARALLVKKGVEMKNIYSEKYD